MQAEEILIHITLVLINLFSHQWLTESFSWVFSLHLLCNCPVSHRVGQVSHAGHVWNGSIWEDLQWTEEVGSNHWKHSGWRLLELQCCVVFLVWPQHSLDSSEDRSEEQWASGFLPGSDVDHCQGDARILLFLWGLWAVSLHICQAHGHR